MIRGYFDHLNFERPMPRVEGGLSLPRLSPLPVRIDFLIDTGASSSTIHPADMWDGFRLTTRELADAGRWHGQSVGVGIGGQVLHYREVGRIHLPRLDRSEWVEGIEALIAQPTPQNRIFPSLLGWDVLRHFRLTLDARTGEVLLAE